MESLNIYTCNVRGLGDKGKRREVFHHLTKKNLDIIFLQETHSTANTNRWWSDMWGNKIYFDNGESNARGVAILFNPKLQIKIHNKFVRGDGRFLLLYTTIRERKVVLANVYAPNNDSPEFFREIHREIDKYAPDLVLYGGDLNTALDPLVDRQGTVNNNKESSEVLNQYMSARELIDVWRHCHPDVNGFTWRKITHNKYCFSRLDYWLMDEHMLQYVEKIEVAPGFKSDHSAVRLILSFAKVNKGKGYWKINTSLFSDRDFVNQINDVIEVELSQNKLWSYKKRWEMLKVTIRGVTIQYTARKQKSKRNEMAVLTRKLKDLEQKLINDSDPLRGTGEQIIRLRNDIEILNRERTQGAVLRCRIKWAEHGDKPTKYFLNLEKRNAAKKSINRLKDASGRTLYNEKDVLKELQQFYSKLYTAKDGIDLDFLSEITIPQISQQSRQELDDRITLTELGRAVKLLNNGKSPGTDGLPIEFYKCFWPKIKEFMLELYNEIIRDGEFHLSARWSVTTLLEKVGKNPLYVKNWRPISLLNLDNKIYHKSISRENAECLSRNHTSITNRFCEGKASRGKYNENFRSSRSL